MNISDELKILFRKPWKIFLTMVILSFFILIILILLLQFVLEGKVIEFIENNYSKVATVISDSSNSKDTVKPEYSTISPDIIRILNDSKYISEIDIRETLSGKLKNKSTVNSYFMFPQTNSIVIFNGTIDKVNDIKKMGDLSYINTSVKVNEVFAGKEGWITKDTTIPVLILDQIGLDSKIKNSNTYHFIAMSSFSDKIGIFNKFLYCYNLNDETISNNEVFKKSEFILKSGLIETENFKKDKKLNYEINVLSQEIKILDNIVTVRLVKDMNLILPILNEIMFLEKGRFLNKDDLDKKITVVNSHFARKNKLSVGDFIDLSLSEESYNINGYESGYPNFLEKLTHEYKENHSYEIVGIYTFSSYDPALAPILYNYNDIFIPKNKNSKNNKNITPYSLSFKVNVKDIDGFENNLAPEINKLGYRISSSKSRWNEVESNLNSLSNSRKKSILYSIILLIFGSNIINYIIIILFKSEYITRKIFAGELRHINNSYNIPLLISIIIANIFSLVFIIFTYENILFKNIQILALEKLPSIGNILFTSVLFLILIDIILVLISRVYLRLRNKKDILELM